MATFVWFGAEDQSGITTVNQNLSGNTGSTYGSMNYISTCNYWNDSNNWRVQEVGGSGGWTGGETGSPPTWVYVSATRCPSGGDDVLLQGLDSSPWGGLSGGPWPKSELLFGGVSAAASGWHNVGTGGSTSGTVDIVVESSYFDGDGVSSMPYQRCRLGSNVTSSATGVASGFLSGLGIWIGSIACDSSESSGSRWSNQTQINIRGMESGVGPKTTATDWFVRGTGHYSVSVNYVDNLILEGEQHSGGFDSNKALDYSHSGNINSICRIAGEHHSRFSYFHTAGSTATVNEMHIAPKHTRSNSASSDIHGYMGELHIYPSETNNSRVLMSYYHSDKVNIGTIQLHEFNPWWSVPFSATGDNVNTMFSNGPTSGASDTIENLIIEAGVFRPYNLDGKLTIRDGEIQSDGVLDLRSLSASGEVEIAGHTGGELAYEGVFVSSSDSSIKFPAGGNFSFKTPSAGATGALSGGRGSAFPRSKGG